VREDQRDAALRLADLLCDEKAMETAPLPHPDHRPEAAALLRELASEQAEIERLRAALTELVACKDLKDRLDSPGIADLDSGRLPTMRRGYDSRKPRAWAAARAALEKPE
jgi:hypothetical protein